MFDDIPANASSAVTKPAEGGARRLRGFGLSHHWITLFFMAQVSYIAGIHMVVTRMT